MDRFEVGQLLRDLTMVSSAEERWANNNNNFTRMASTELEAGDEARSGVWKGMMRQKLKARSKTGKEEDRIARASRFKSLS